MSKREASHILGGGWSMNMFAESNALALISTYMAENRLNTTLDTEALQNMALEAIFENSDKIGDASFCGLKKTHLILQRICRPKISRRK